jgi:hypothetical protein
MPGCWQQVLEHDRVRRSSVGDHLNGCHFRRADGLLEEPAGLWVPENRSWVLSCEFVGEAIGGDDRRMTLRLLYLTVLPGAAVACAAGAELGSQGRRAAHVAPQGHCAATRDSSAPARLGRPGPAGWPGAASRPGPAPVGCVNSFMQLVGTRGGGRRAGRADERGRADPC